MPHIHSGKERDPVRRDILPAGDICPARVVRGASETRRPQPRPARAQFPRERPSAAAACHRPAQGEGCNKYQGTGQYNTSQHSSNSKLNRGMCYGY